MTVRLRERLLLRLPFLNFVTVRAIGGKLRSDATDTEKIGGLLVPVLVKPVFTILFFEVGVRAGRLWRGIEIVEVRFVNNFKIIQNLVGMNFIKQVSSIYVFQVIESTQVLRII